MSSSYDNNSFKPKSAFEGWVKASIEDLCNRLADFKKDNNEKWGNHLHHHEILEGRILKWGIVLTSLATFLGWLIGKHGI